MQRRASKTGRALGYAVAFCAASCGPSARKPAPRPHVPVPPVLVVTDANLALRESAILELHALLLAAARDDATELPSELEPARVAYAHTFGADADPSDERLAAVTRVLAECSTAACASTALDRARAPNDAQSRVGDRAADPRPGAGDLFAGALPNFIARDWDERAAVAWSGIERAHAAFGPWSDALLVTLARDLGVTWSSPAPVVDLVTASPPAGRTALLTPLLAARGSCFARRHDETQEMQNARIVDCVVVRALLAGESPHRAILGARLWTVLVVHAVAATITNDDPRHLSVDRRAIAAVEPALLEVVTREWHGGPFSAERAASLVEASRPSPTKTSAPPDNVSR